MSGYNPIAIDAAAHVVQLALTPIFLLTGIASLLNVFSTRLGRIADQVDKLADDVQRNPRRLARLRLRSRVLDSAVLLAAIAGALTCAAAMTLFVGEIGTGSAGRLLFALFGGALARDADNLVATMTEHIRLTTELIIAAN